LDQTPNSPSLPYDFRICKLCCQPSGVPTFTLGANHLYRCHDCDFHYLDRLDPPPDDITVTLTELQQRYIDKRLNDNARILTSRLNLVREFSDLTGQHCLDIGAGVGQFLLMLADGGAVCQGIEPSSLRREFARQRFGLKLSWQLAEEPFWFDQHDSFDLITLWDVLEHVNAPVATLQAAFALLKPGGLLFVETDNRDTISYRLSTWVYRLTRGGSALLLPNFYRQVPYGHKQIFRPAQLYTLAVRCGFELVAATPPSTEITQIKTPGYRPSGQTVMIARKPV